MWVPASDHLPHSCPTMNLLQLAANLVRNKKEVGFRGPTFIEILHSSLSSLISLPLKAPPGFFLCIFSSLTCLKKPVFSKWNLLWWKVTRQAGLGSSAWLIPSDQRKVLASLSLFLKSEKIPALLYVGKEPECRPFHDFQPVPSATGLGHRSQITEGPVLKPFSHTENPQLWGTVRTTN